MSDKRPLLYQSHYFTTITVKFGVAKMKPNQKNKLFILVKAAMNKKDETLTIRMNF